MVIAISQLRGRHLSRYGGRPRRRKPARFLFARIACVLKQTATDTQTTKNFALTPQVFDEKTRKNPQNDLG